MSDVFFLLVGLCGIAAALTGGRFGFFRPDLSMNATADIFAVAATIMLVWMIAFDFPAGAGHWAGVYVALIANIGVACGAGDFRVSSWRRQLHKTP
jgi:CDP-diglyceride synthetase